MDDAGRSADPALDVIWGLFCLGDAGDNPDGTDVRVSLVVAEAMCSPRCLEGAVNRGSVQVDTDGSECLLGESLADSVF